MKQMNKNKQTNKTSLIYLQFHFSVNHSRRKRNITEAKSTRKGNGERFIARAILKESNYFKLKTG